jgi:hypothetical protein
MKSEDIKVFSACVKCDRLGLDCVPNLMALPFPDLLEWWKERQRFLGWSNQFLSEKSNIPLGTINRIKAGEDDCRFSTMRAVIHALLGGYSVEFPCQKKLDQEFAHIEALEKQNAELLKNIEELNSRLASIDELHRNDIRVIKAEYMEEISFLKEQLRAWQRQKT